MDAARRNRPGRVRLLAAAVVSLFLLSLFFVFLNTRFNPSEGSSRSARVPEAGASTIVLDGYALSFSVTGAERGKPPAILLLGEPGQSSVSLRTAFRFLEADRRVVAYDPRGSGNSQAKPSLSDYTVGRLVEELEGIRRDVARAESVVIIGHSFGGAIALRYAMTYPGSVDRLVLISPLPPDGYRYESVPALLMESLDALRKAGIPPTDPVKADGWQARYDYATALEGLRDTSSAAALRGLGGSFGTARALISSMASGPRTFTNEFRNLTMPVLIVHGDPESPFTRAEYQEELHRTLPQSRLLRFDKSAHWAFIEEPERFASAVLSFLEER